MEAQKKEISMERATIFILITMVVSTFICFGSIANTSDNPKFTKQFNKSLFNNTDEGLFSAEILLDDREDPKLGKDMIGLGIHNVVTRTWTGQPSR